MMAGIAATTENIASNAHMKPSRRLAVLARRENAMDLSDDQPGNEDHERGVDDR